MRQLASITQQAMHEGQRFFQRQQMIIGSRQPLWQRRRQKFVPAQRTQATPEGGAASMGAEPLIAEPDRD
jgi:hypothetical protein